MKILLLSDEFPPDGSGGDAQVVANLAKGYVSHGHEVFLAVATKNKEMAGCSRWEGIPIERIFADYDPRWQSWISLWNPPAVRAVKKALAEFKPDIVHAHGVNRYLSYRSLVEARKSGAKVFLTAHDAMLYHYSKAFDEKAVSALTQLKHFKFRYNPLRNFIIRRALSSVSAIVSVSESLAKALRVNGVPVSHVIHNGINVDEWKVSAQAVEQFKRHHNIHEHAILFGGRLSGLKGAFVAVEALKKVLAAVPDAQLLVIGEKNDSAKKMVEDARDLGIEQKIQFTGRLSGDDLRAAYHAAALVIVPSLYLDPFPTINLEAGACSKPVVATSFGGSPEIIKDGVSGYTVDPHDRDAFALRIIELLRNEVLARKLGGTGLIQVTKEYALSTQSEAYLSLFESAR